MDAGSLANLDWGAVALVAIIGGALVWGLFSFCGKTARTSTACRRRWRLIVTTRNPDELVTRSRRQTRGARRLPRYAGKPWSMPLEKQVEVSQR